MKSFSRSLTTVTPLSKLLAAILFIVLPFGGFYAGIRYQQSIQSNNISADTLEDRIMKALEKDSPLFKHSEQIVTIAGISGEFVRFSTMPKPGVELDPAFGFAEKQNGEWKILQFGTGGDPTEFYKTYNIPKELRDKGF